MIKTKKEIASHGIPDDIKSKICCLRVSFIASMVAAAVICGSVAFKQVEQLELDLAEQTYYSVAASAIKGAQSITQRKIQSTEIMAATISYHFPNASSYPFVALPGYSEISSKVTEVSTSLLGYSVIVTPEQVPKFERFAAATYLELGYPQGAGMSDFGFGIWRNASASVYNDHRDHDSKSGIEYGGEYSILVPILLVSNTSAANLMYNSYSGNITRSSTDAIINCSIAANATGTKPKCTTITNFFELQTKTGPSAVILQPIYPVNDPTTVVGFSTAPITWGDVLNDVVPNSVNGLYCVISSESLSYTYRIDHGKPKLLGKGDLHDTSYDRYKKSATITAVDEFSSPASIYTLTVYPSDTFFDAKSPWLLTTGFVTVIAICTAIFFLYDFLMRNEARQRKVIIELKRRFVRFVSHEIRTPLNTVCLGLELLRSDLNPTLIDEIDVESEGTAPHQRLELENEKLLNWSNLVDDILENSNNAVGILNDLLNYDKMEQGTFNLEVTAVPIWDVASKTISSFDIEAKKRSIQLTCTIVRPPSVDLARMYVAGDDVRLRQVIRNIISNSLKFAPQGTGKVKVTMMHNPDGLPNATTPREDILTAATSTTLVSTYPRAGTIKIVIEDNGIGLSEAQLQRLFQEGVQFEPNKLQVRLLCTPDFSQFPLLHTLTSVSLLLV
jgi:signal transduction histidine kinase